MEVRDVDENAELAYICAASLQHGLDGGDSDYEVGDLQQALRYAWEIMTDEQRTQAYETFCDETQLDVFGDPFDEENDE